MNEDITKILIVYFTKWNFVRKLREEERRRRRRSRENFKESGVERKNKAVERMGLENSKVENRLDYSISVTK